VAKLEPPPVMKPSGGAFRIGTAGTAIQQAARAAAASRNSGTYGDYGTGPALPDTDVRSDVNILSDTQGVDFAPYLQRVLENVRTNWYNLIPEVARPPLLKQGKVAIEFVILPNGQVSGMRLAGPSGDVSLDRAAWGGITASDPFQPLPKEFHGPYLALRFHFYYNPNRNEMR
jgi:TonB family protein